MLQWLSSLFVAKNFTVCVGWSRVIWFVELVLLLHWICLKIWLRVGSATSLNLLKDLTYWLMIFFRCTFLIHWWLWWKNLVGFEFMVHDILAVLLWFIEVEELVGFELWYIPAQNFGVFKHLTILDCRLSFFSMVGWMVEAPKKTS